MLPVRKTTIKLVLQVLTKLALKLDLTTSTLGRAPLLQKRYLVATIMSFDVNYIDINYTKSIVYKGFVSTGPPQFQYQKENPLTVP